MTKINVKKIVAYWKNGSKKNLTSAKDIGTRTKHYVDALFLLHLAIEKALKAAAVHKNKDHAPYSHNLLHLAKNAGIPTTGKRLALIKRLNSFNLECRYPDEKYRIYKLATNELFRSLFHETSLLQKWIFEQFR